MNNAKHAKHLESIFDQNGLKHIAPVNVVIPQCTVILQQVRSVISMDVKIETPHWQSCDILDHGLDILDDLISAETHLNATVVGHKDLDIFSWEIVTEGLQNKMFSQL